MDDQWLQSYRGQTVDGREVRIRQCNFHVDVIFTCSLQGVTSLADTEDEYFAVNTPGTSTDEAFSKAKAEVTKQFGEGGIVPVVGKG